jgi:hypothetical protein
MQKKKIHEEKKKRINKMPGIKMKMKKLEIKAKSTTITIYTFP